MSATKNDIIRELEKVILPLQGFRLPSGTATHVGLEELEDSFPNNTFPLGAVHEFLSTNMEDAAATAGFISGLLSALMQRGSACIWISARRTIFPATLKTFGIEPHHVIFIDLPIEKNALWVMEEALKCEGVAAVVAELKEIDFTASRRLQLAVEKSRVTGFIIHHHYRNLNTLACVSRWKITQLASELPGNMPGVGFARWNVELLKIRNGKPGKWQIEWSAGKFGVIDDKKAIAVLKPQLTQIA